MDPSRSLKSRSKRKRKESQRHRNKRIRRINNFLAKFPHVITQQLLAKFAVENFGDDWVNSLLKWTRDAKEPSHDPLARALFHRARKIGVLRESFQQSLDAIAFCDTIKDWKQKMANSMKIPVEYITGQAAERAKVKERGIAAALAAKDRYRRKSPPKPKGRDNRSNATGAVRPRQTRSYNRKR